MIRNQASLHHSVLRLLGSLEENQGYIILITVTLRHSSENVYHIHYYLHF